MTENIKPAEYGKIISDILITALRDRPKDFSYECGASGCGYLLNDKFILTDKLKDAEYWFSGLIGGALTGEFAQLSTEYGLIDLGCVNGYRAYRAFAKWKKVEDKL